MSHQKVEGRCRGVAGRWPSGARRRADGRSSRKASRIFAGSLLFHGGGYIKRTRCTRSEASTLNRKLLVHPGAQRTAEAEEKGKGWVGTVPKSFSIRSLCFLCRCVD